MDSLRSLQTREWHREGFLISTDIKLIDSKAFNAALESDQIPWATALPGDELKVTLERSLNFGIYDLSTNASHQQDNSTSQNSRPKMIGFARVITDYTTIAYLTDVYVLPAYAGRGLGSWLIKCVKEWWDTIPSGRRIAFVVAEGEHEKFYGRVLGSTRMGDDQLTTGNTAKQEKSYRLVSGPGGGKTVT